ncbi:MAG: hypothetical protein ACRDZW_05820 [Acidimicrobiales bacterium]
MSLLLGALLGLSDKGRLREGEPWSAADDGALAAYGGVHSGRP